MLALLAFGFLSSGLEPGSGTVDVPAAQTAQMRPATASGGASSGLPLGAVQWSLPLDPSDRVPYAYDFSSLLQEDEMIAGITRLTMSAVGASLGVQIDDDSDRLPIIDSDGKKVGLWLLVGSAFQSNAAFSGSGSSVGVSILIETDSTPSKSFERTAILTVRQQ